MAARLAITGRVQGVGYRDWAVDTAGGLGLTGWVRNHANGSVEAHAEGAATALDAFTAACRGGPPAARVDAVERSEVADEGTSGFSRR